MTPVSSPSRKVLVVDDSPVAREVVGKRLLASGLEAVSCKSAAEARASDATDLSCALLDIDLGDEDGTELAKNLRATHPELPIAFFSGSATPEVKARAKRLGPVFGKPDDLDSALAWVRAHAART